MNNQEILTRLSNDPPLRKAAARRSHKLFFALYLSHHIKYPIAPFQEEMFAISEDSRTELSVITAFRYSAKSTLMTFSYPIWAILGKLQKKFVLIVSRTQNQVQTHMDNIKQELETNTLLKSELGPFQEEKGLWRSSKLVLKKKKAAIVSASMDQSIRGIRHMEHRPDLIICDDIEDLGSVMTKESRDKTYQWLTREVMLTKSDDAKIVIVGNKLHEDSVLMRLKDKIAKKELNGIYRSYPIISPVNKIAWPGRFSDMEAIKKLRLSIGDERVWQIEYMLNIIPEDSQIILPEWIKHYDKPPDDKDSNFRKTLVGVDLAISQKSTGDYTAMVPVNMYDHESKMRLYVLPSIINKRLRATESIHMIRSLNSSLKKDHFGYPEFLIEDVGFQDILVESVRHENFTVTGVNPGGKDKQTRLSIIAPMIKEGKVLFPQKGAENLINQLVYFGREKHDDLVDAFIYTCMQANKLNERQPRIRLI